MGLFQSTDGGQSWRSTSDGVPDEWRNTTYWLAFDPTQRGLIWGAFSGQHDCHGPRIGGTSAPRKFMGGVAVSTDGGHHWEPSISGMPAHSITHILLDPSSPVGSRTLYACAFGLGVYKSIDNGKTWTQKNNGIAGEEPFAVAYYALAGRLFVSRCLTPQRGQRLLRSQAPELSIARRIKRNTGSAWICLPA